MKRSQNQYQQSMLMLLMRLQRSRQQAEGYTLVVTVAMLIILTSILLTAAIIGRVDTGSTKASASSSKGFFAAEAGLNQRANEVRDLFEGFNRPSDNNDDLSDNPTTWQDCLNGVTGGGDFACENDLSIADQTVLSYVEDLTGDIPQQVRIPDNEEFGGLSAQEFRYDVISVAQRQSDLESSPTAILGMRFKSRLVPLFQFAIFYENDVDFSIPPNMSINGRVHSNSSVYLNSSAGSTLRINGRVSAAKRLYRGNKSSTGSQCAGTVIIPTESGVSQSLGCSGNNITEYLSTTDSPSDIPSWGNAISIRDGNTDIDGDGNIIGFDTALSIPEPDSFSPEPGQLYWDSADLRLVLRVDAADNPIGIEVRDRNNNPQNTLSQRLAASCPVPERALLPEFGGTPNRYEQGDTRLYLPLPNTGPDRFRRDDIVTIGTDTGAPIDIDGNVIRGLNATSIRLRQRLNTRFTIDPTLSLTAPFRVKVRKAVVSTSDTFYNYREKHNRGGQEHAGQYIRMLNVDVKALLDCVHDQDLMVDDSGNTIELDDRTDGGLVWYFTVEGPGGLNNKPELSDGDSPTNNDVDGDDNSRIGSTYGIRLYNGSSLVSTEPGAPRINGLTIVSDEAVYIQGDYNKDAADWRPAAVISDSINILSNNWRNDDTNSTIYGGNNLPTNPIAINDSQRLCNPVWWDTRFCTGDNVGTRIPTETTMNVALISGTEITGGGNAEQVQAGTTPFNNGSGGVNNYPRFHEHWGATVPNSVTQECDAIYIARGEGKQNRVCFNYRGSLVSLNAPRRVNSDFCGSSNPTTCNIYTPPVRNWDYDSRFDDAGQLPPLTPRAVFLSQELFRRDFDQSSVGSQLIATLPSLAALMPSLQPNFTF